jgi:hypothetical protein
MRTQPQAAVVDDERFPDTKRHTLSSFPGMYGNILKTTGD